ncbi:MAG: sigma-54 dependent transcriptional regulator [Acidobacteriota bacterium]
MTGNKDKILIVDDQHSVRFGLRSLLEGEGYRVLEADTGAQALALITEQAPQLILLDLRLPDTDGLTLLPRIKAIDDEAPIIMLTAHGTIETAITALKNGAENFLTKPFDPDSLLILIARTLDQTRTRRERLLLGLAQQQVAAEYFVGQSDAIKRIHATIERLAASDTTVLLQGETGTGKGMVANLIHRQSERRHKPFVALNCAGLSKELLESELFGHEKGAFTSAVTSKAGLFELAHQGTIFFDEISEMELAVQARLLNVLEQKRFRRVGGVQEKEVAVRIIAATNRNLQHEVKRGRFREDLFYRLNVMPILLPGLRERREDILPLVQHFIAHFNHKLNRRIAGVTPKAEALLLGYPWPGNIRELRNIVERAMILCAQERLHASDLPFGDFNDEPSAAASEEFLSLEEVERLQIERVLTAQNGNLSRTAEILGVTRTTLYNKLRRYGLNEGG